VRGVAVPGGPGIRDDRGVEPGFEIPLFYDSLISKLIVWGESRAQAVRRLTRALDEYRVAGVSTTLPFFRWLVRQPAFAAGRFSTTYLDRVLAERDAPFVEPTGEDARDAAIAAALSAWLLAHRAGTSDAAPAAASTAWRRAARTESLR
jgi:acetyl-CoA carboxylase biotin carboxylase subunit